MTPHRLPSLLLRLGIVCSLLLALSKVAAAAPNGRTYWFDIPAQSLADAITELSRQAHISIGTSVENIARYRGHPIRGTLSVDQALADLLDGTGLGYRFINSEAVVIFVSPKQLLDHPATNTTVAKIISTDTRPTIENLIITATKMAERSQSTPASVSVVGGDVLQELAAVSVGQLSSQVSGLMTTNLGPGRKKIFIRGLSDGAFNGPTRSTVATYLDEAPLTFNDPYPDMRLVDIQRVEVLRGPQGTLYGSGALSGVFRVVPNPPNLENYEGFAASSVSYTKNGGPNGAVEGMINLPLAKDRIGLRLVGSAETDEGYIDDIRLHRNNVNDALISSFRGIMTWRLNADWSLNAMASLQRIKLDDTQYFVGSLGPYKRNNYVAEPYSDLFKVGNIKLTGNLGWAQLMSSTTIVRRNNRSRNDASLAVSKFIDSPVVPSMFDTHSDIDTLSQEIRLSSQGPVLDWVAGTFLLDRTETTNYQLIVPQIGIHNPPATQLANDVVFHEDRSDQAKEIAAFVNLNFRLASRLRLGAGLRLFYSQNKTVASLGGADTTSTQDLQGHNSRMGIMPQAVISYRFGDDALAYLSVSGGYRNGGVNINTPVGAIVGFDPDESEIKADVFTSDNLWNFEFGLKQEWFDRRLRLNSSIFYVLWEGVQTNQYLNNGLPFVLNAGNARNYGFELEASALVTSRIEISANAFWNSPELNEGNAFLGAKAGDLLPGIARLTLGASASYSFDIGHYLQAQLSCRYTYTGKSYLMFGSQSPTMGNYHSADIRVNISRGRWTIGAFIQNSWSEKGNSFSFGNPFSLGKEEQVTPLQPLTIGLTARISY